MDQGDTPFKVGDTVTCNPEFPDEVLKMSELKRGAVYIIVRFASDLEGISDEWLVVKEVGGELLDLFYNPDFFIRAGSLH